jgi:glutamine synthetase
VVSDKAPVRRGRLTLAELEQRVARREIETVIVGFTDHYGRLMGKRYAGDVFVEETAHHGTHGCNYLLTTDMEMEPVAGYRFASWEQGYGDFHLVPDLDTLVVASWLDKTALVLCDVADAGAKHVPVAPRSLLRHQVNAARELGFTINAASELEYYVFQNTYRQAGELDYRGLEPAGWYLEDYHILQGTRTESFTAAVRRHLSESGVPVESSKGEWGLGQHELNVRYTDVLQMADRHVVFKQCLKEVAERSGLSVTFMAKFAHDRAGSSCHLHLSLCRDGRNAFPGESQLGPVQCSDVFRWFLGGWIAHAPDVMVMYAPTINSYKRYVDASWAPTRLAWSYDNRTAGFRVVGAGPSLRIECEGIGHRLEPPACFTGDVYAARDLPRVPHTLREAAETFAASAFARRAFGDDVVEHYAHFFMTEDAAFRVAVTDWERRRYFERI